jgi:low affinity Fe/Cu permease
MLTQAIRQSLTWTAQWTSHPGAFLIVGIYAALWWYFAPSTMDWHAVATLATWLMTLFIQRGEHRDTQAIHAKLDELVRATGKADNELTKMDKKEPEEIEEHRDAKPA